MNPPYKLGFIDFAGGALVHCVGGAIALVGAWVIGPRIDRFDKDGNVLNIQSSNIINALIGVMLLFFGWFGFNGGSATLNSAELPNIIANTVIAGAFGGLTAIILSRVLKKTISVHIIINGILSGLVAITSCANIIDFSGATILGVTGCIVVSLFQYIILNKLHVDDAVGASSVHLIGGAWGTIVMVFIAFSNSTPIYEMFHQLCIQSLGVIAISFWSIGVSLVVFLSLKKIDFLRVTPENEKIGLNMSEHHIKTTYTATMETMGKILLERDLSSRARTEIGSEIGDIARMFNLVIRTFEKNILTVNNISNALSEKADSTTKCNSRLAA